MDFMKILLLDPTQPMDEPDPCTSLR